MPPDHPDIAENLNSLADLYNKQDRLEEAEPLFRRALAICEKGSAANSPLTAAILQNLTVTLRTSRQRPGGGSSAQASHCGTESGATSHHPEIAGAIHHLAHNLHLQRRFSEAEVQYKVALKMREASQPAGHFDIAKNLKDLAVLYIEEQRFAEALSLLKRAGAMIEKTYSADHPLLIEPLELMAVVAERERQPVEALNKARRATSIAVEREKLTRNNSVYFRAHVRLAWNAYEAAQRKDIALLEEALIVAQRADLTSTAASISNLALRLTPSDRALREIIRERQDLENAREKSDREFDALFTSAQDGRAEAEKKVRTALAQIQSRLKDIDARLKTDFPKYSELVRPAPVTLKEIREFLQPGEALVNFLIGETETFVWAVTGEQAVWHRLDISRSEIEAYERRLRDALQVDRLEEIASKGQLFNLGVAHEVYKKLFGQIEGVIGGKRRLIVVSSGVLTSMPFQALVLTPPPVKQPSSTQFKAYRDADWFVRRYALSVLPAISSLKALRMQGKARDERRPLIGFANPRYRDQKLAGGATRSLTRAYTAYWKGAKVNLDALRAGLAPLPESENELRSVATSVGAAEQDLKFGAEASETVVKEAKLENYRIVYFAAHGLVAGEISGLGEPALALAIPEEATEIDDGLLTMSEISKLRLDADWVVLSACNTAAGDKQGADALSGLARAFFYAGARALLVSHWLVETQAAVRLATGAFEVLRENPNMERAEALRQSMLALIADPTDPLNAYPALWAPFFVVGEGGAH